MNNEYKIKNKVRHDEGFIALMTVIIISVILFLTVSSLSFAGFYGRFNILDSELKERSVALAEACVDTAILRMVNDINYNPVDDFVSVGGENCLIKNITPPPGNNPRTIKAQSNYKNYFTNLEAIVDTTSFAVQSWQELPNF